MCVSKPLVSVRIPFTSRERSLESCILRDGCCFPYRKLQGPQTRSRRCVLYASSTSFTGTCWNFKWRPVDPSGPWLTGHYAIHVNMFWFLSLCVSLSCDLSATLVQPWVRRYLKFTRHSETPTHRVRTRAFLFAGIQECAAKLCRLSYSHLFHCGFYTALTSLPVIFERCPFQTSVTSVFRCMTLLPFSVHLLWPSDQDRGATEAQKKNHIMNAAKAKRLSTKKLSR
jgi:hypothetical protein